MSARFRVLAADFLSDTEVEAPILDGIADITLGRAWDESELTDLVPSADAIILFHDIPRLSEKTLSLATRCKGLVRAGVGFNNVDLDSANRHGIVVCNVPDYGTEEVADHAILLLLSVARRLRHGHEAIRGNVWDYRSVIETPRLRGKTLGLVGCGRIGTATALRAKAFGLDVVFYDPYAVPGYDKALGIRRVDSLNELLEQSQFVSLHCYLDANSYHLIDAAALARMPRGSILINTARGGVVDQEAMVDALESGHLLGAGIDVLEREPLDNERLRHHPNILLSPHSAFYSKEGFVELRRKTAEEIRRLLLGQPLRCPVNRDGLVNPRASVI